MEKKNRKWLAAVSPLAVIGLVVVLLLAALSIPLGPSLTLEETPLSNAPSESQPIEVSAVTQASESLTLIALGIGVFAGEDEAEAIYVVKIDPNDGAAVNIITFPPSLPVEVDGTTKAFKLVYHDELYSSLGDNLSAINRMAQTLVDNFGITPDHYIVYWEDDLAKIIDELGGLDVTIPAAYGELAAGEHHFDGQTTWLYVASIPKPGIPEELPRIERHKHVLKALRAKLLSAEILPDVPKIAKDHMQEQYLKTNLSATQILELVSILEQANLEEVEFTVILEK